MNCSKLIDTTKLYLDKNASTILTVAGTIGVVATAITTAQASIKLTKDISDDESLTKRDILRKSVRYYRKPVLIGLGTIGCVVGANVLNKKKQANMTSAYILLENSYKEYRDKVKQLYGDESDSKVIGAIAKDKIGNNYKVSDERYMLFYDPISDRYFERTMEQVQYAEYHFNRNFILRDYAKLNEFYNFLGLDGTNEGEVLGWSTFMGYNEYGYSWVDFKHNTVELEDGMECCIIDYPFMPTLDYLDY